MRLYAPVYEGDSLLRPDAALGERATTVFKAPVKTVDLVRSNIPAEAASEPALDLATIERDARAMRGATVARMLKAAYNAVEDWFERIDTRERDNFFAGSCDLADLEQRQRHWERTGCSHY